MRDLENNAASWISRWAARSGAHLAVVDRERRLDYAAFERRIACLAGVLVQRGVGPGDRVAILARNGSAYLETVFAAAWIGAIALPINTRLSPHEVRFLFDDSTPHALIHSEAHRALADAACESSARPPDVRLEIADAPDAPHADYERCLAAASPHAAPVAVEPDTPMILMYTSGTTGRPKGAVLPHRKALYNCKNAEIYFGTSREDRVLVVAPLFHSLGLQILALPVLYAGGSLVLEDHFEPESFWPLVERERITYVGGVPTMYRRLLEVPEAAAAGQFDLSSLRFLFTAGAAAPVDLVRAYRAIGLRLAQGYGQTESSTLTCLAPEDAERKAGTVGRPVRHVELRIIAPDTLDGPVSGWRDVAVGERGEIVARGPIVMLGYWKRPEATAETLREGWLRTGDLATRDAEGFITLVGRSREMFISGGENVYPAEVEATYAEHPAIREIAIVGVPDPTWGEVGRAHVVLHGGKRTDAEALTAWGRERLAKFKIPAQFVFESELPKTASGKVQRHRLAPR